jgi:hypothetical protein
LFCWFSPNRRRSHQTSGRSIFWMVSRPITASRRAREARTGPLGLQARSATARRLRSFPRILDAASMDPAQAAEHPACPLGWGRLAFATRAGLRACARRRCRLPTSRFHNARGKRKAWFLLPRIFSGRCRRKWRGVPHCTRNTDQSRFPHAVAVSRAVSRGTHRRRAFAPCARRGSF